MAMKRTRPVNLSRRTFLAGSAALAVARAPGLARGLQSPNDEIGIAIVGLRGRGRSHIRAFKEIPGVRIVAVCDVDRRVLDKTVADLAADGVQAEGIVDFREVLDRADVDAVSLATPNHWHALQTIWACQAEKDVYVEKPVSHSIWEGRQAVRAAERYGRIVQAGTQIRSNPGIREAFAWLHEGHLGDVRIARGFCYKPRKSIGKVKKAVQVDEAVDYDLWTGPAPMKPLQRERLHYDWHWVFDTGNGDVGNQGIHQMDLCRWALGEEGLAPRTLSVGARLGYDDDGNTPNTQVVAHLYDRAPLLFEVRGLPSSLEAQEGNWREGMDDYEGIRIGVVIDCEQGSLHVPSYTEAHAYGPDGEHLLSWKGGRDLLHYGNFIDAVRSRKASAQAMPLVEGHVSSALCHVGNMAHLVGVQEDSSSIGTRVAAQPEVAGAFERMVAHLERNGALSKSELLSFGDIQVDPKTEGFGPKRLQALARRDGRGEFTIPETV